MGSRLIDYHSSLGRERESRVNSFDIINVLPIESSGIIAGAYLIISEASIIISSLWKILSGEEEKGEITSPYHASLIETVWHHRIPRRD